LDIMDYGLKIIAKGLCLSNESRKDKIKRLNTVIDSMADSIRSASDNDGMPHATTVGDPIGSKLEKIERLEKKRDEEPNRVNAIEWAEQYLHDNFPEDQADALIKAINLELAREKSRMQSILEDNHIGDWVYYRA